MTPDEQAVEHLRALDARVAACQPVTDGPHTDPHGFSVAELRARQALHRQATADRHWRHLAVPDAGHSGTQ